MELIIFKRKVFKLKIENVFHIRVDTHYGKRIRLVCKLQCSLFEMIIVQMYIAESMNEITGLQVANLGDHHCKKCIRRDIEGHTKKNICTSLVKLAAQFSFCHIKLEHSMAGHQCHFRKVGNIPGANNDPAAVGVCFDLPDHI